MGLNDYEEELAFIIKHGLRTVEDFTVDATLEPDGWAVYEKKRRGWEVREYCYSCEDVHQLICNQGLQSKYDKGLVEINAVSFLQPDLGEAIELEAGQAERLDELAGHLQGFDNDTPLENILRTLRLTKKLQTDLTRKPASQARQLVKI